jgi:putative peptidoglycan lipid II flippase
MTTLFARLRNVKALKIPVVVGVVVAIQLILSLTIQIIVIRAVGAGQEADAFIGAQTISLVVTSIVGTSLHNIWQSRLAIAASVVWKQELERALTMTLLLILPLALLLIGLSSPFTSLIFVGFSSEQLERTVTLTQINILSMVFNIIGLILSAGGRATGRFILVELVPAIITVIATVGVAIWAPSEGVLAVTWIMCARSAIIFLLLWMILGCPLLCSLRHGNLRSTFKDVLALMGGSSIYKLGPVVDRYWGSQASAGNLTLYNLW